MAKPQQDLFAALPGAGTGANKAGRGTKRPQREKADADAEEYSAEQIEVLEGLEPVRRLPGMYIGGTDAKALHHLFSEILDNAMDEAVAGYASRIDVHLGEDGFLTVADNGRGIPADPHPRYKPKSALEVILTTLHSGGKFSRSVYKTSGGLHGVGISVVNALSEALDVEVTRNGVLYGMRFSRGVPQSGLENRGPARGRRGTTVRFRPDPEIFGNGAAFDPARLFRMTRAKAYLFGGVEIHWHAAPELLAEAGSEIPAEAVFHFPEGLKDYLMSETAGAALVTKDAFVGRVELASHHARVEWAVAWVTDKDGLSRSYCNTIPTPEGGTHEQGLRQALLKGLRAYGELTNNRRAAEITAEDIMGQAVSILSVFIPDPKFQGQTKERLAAPEATRLVESAVRDAFDHWLAESPQQAAKLLDWGIAQAEERQRRRREKEAGRQQASRKLRLPGKLADCTIQAANGTEIFIVEGDSAGGSAKSARDRETQAVLPLRGKILNVANASSAKLAENQLLSDLVLALGVGTGAKYRAEDLRYERVIIMTDADVDGAHIAALLITFFYREMPRLIEDGHLFLAAPPLFKLTQGTKSYYARDERHRDALIASVFKAGQKVEVSRFKGLGEMNAAQLKETTMDPARRTLLRVEIGEGERDALSQAVSALMGSKAEARFRFIQERAPFARDLDI